MSHPIALIESIRRQVAQDYDPAIHRYVIEKSIPGTRMMPDILVCDAGGSMVCAVEIGYTRPEKLTAYRKELRIPDVRWYAKDGTLHADVNVKMTRLSVEVTMQPPSEVSVYTIHNRVDCFDSDCCCTICGGYVENCPCPSRDVDDDDDMPLLAIAEEPERDSPEFGDLLGKSMEYLPIDVTTVIITDRVRAWYACYCDKCGAVWFGVPSGYYEELMVWSLHTDLAEWTPQEFGRWFGAARKMPWSEAVNWIAECGLKLQAEDGYFLQHEDAEEIRAQVRIVHQEAIAAAV